MKLNHRNTWSRRALACLAGLGLAGAALVTSEAPSWASCTTNCNATGNVSASVNVASSILLSLSTSSLDFGQNQAPGSTSSGVPPVTVTIGTNSSAGYALSVSASDFSALIPASSLSVTESASGALAGNLQTTQQQQIIESGHLILAGSGSISGPQGDAYTSAWSLHIPANATGGSATSTITYLAAAN